MNIALIEPFFGGSHKQWALGLKQHSQHTINIFCISGQHWKWRMHGGAVTLAEQYNKSTFKADLVLATDMLDLSLFLALTRKKTTQLPVALYLHENQLTYPWSSKDRDAKSGRNLHYAFINYTSALVADKCFFNSQFHKNSFLYALPAFLKQYPDHTNMDSVPAIAQKSQTLHLGLDLQRLAVPSSAKKEKPKYATLLWNHRWEYDKNPEAFFKALFELKDRGIKFNLIVLGEELDKSPDIFLSAKKRLAAEILQWGYCENVKEYASWLWQADILPVTSNQDFFGVSIIEAMACDNIPLLPKRLVYPEHFQESWQQRQFYYKDGEFINRLQRMIMDISLLRKQHVTPFVQKYDWGNCITSYDAVLENLIV